MKFVLNSSFPKSPASLACISGLARQLHNLGHSAIVGDWSNYSKYDVAIILSRDVDFQAIKSSNPDILIGLADPKSVNDKQVREADFLLVSSIEQREAFMSLNRNQFIYYMIPDFESSPVQHSVKERYRILYHGNKVHLNSSYHGLVPALNALGRKYPIQLDAVYNYKQLGLWTHGRPDPILCPTHDLQWYPNCYATYFGSADIGVVQNLMPFNNMSLVRKLGTVSRSLLLENSFDHLVKYKSSANAGRAFVFGYFGIPVVADATPSTCEAIIDGYSGRLVLTDNGWYDALEELICSPQKRSLYAANFRDSISQRFAPDISAARLVSYINGYSQKALVTPQRIQPPIIPELLRSMIRRLEAKLRP